MFERKSNGGDINQLIVILESASDSEREQILLNLQQEDPAKAAILKLKIITVEKVYSLDDESLSRVLEDLEDDTISDTLRGLDLELRKRALSFLTGDRKRQVTNNLKLQKGDAEISASRRALVNRVRQLESRGRVSLGGVRNGKPKLKAA